MIKMTKVTKAYGNLKAIKDVDLTINNGEFVFIVGPSGAGKSTFIKLLLKEIEPSSGKININGLELTEMKRRDIP